MISLTWPKWGLISAWQLQSGIPARIFFSRDGTALVFRDQRNPDTGDNIAMLALEDGAEPVWLLDEPFNERNA